MHSLYHPKNTCDSFPGLQQHSAYCLTDFYVTHPLKGTGMRIGWDGPQTWSSKG